MAIGYVTMCQNCDLPVSDYGRRGRRSPTGWVHWGFWQGIRCPGRLVGAQPGSRISEAEYLTWVNARLGISGDAGG